MFPEIPGNEEEMISREISTIQVNVDGQQMNSDDALRTLQSPEARRSCYSVGKSRKAKNAIVTAYDSNLPRNIVERIVQPRTQGWGGIDRK